MVWHVEMVVANSQPFLRGKHSVAAGWQLKGYQFLPNSNSVHTFSKRKEKVTCMGQRKGTIPSEQTRQHSTPLPSHQPPLHLTFHFRPQLNLDTLL